MKTYTSGKRIKNGWFHLLGCDYTSDLLIGMEKMSGFLQKPTDGWDSDFISEVLGVKVSLSECSEFLNDLYEVDEKTFKHLESLMEKTYVLYAGFAGNGEYYVWTIDL